VRHRRALRTLLGAGSVWLLFGALPAASPAAPTWLSPLNLSTPGRSAEAPQVATDAAGDAFAVWQRFDGANTMIQIETRPAGGNWGAPLDLSAIGGNASKPELAADPGGDETAIWRRYDGSHFVIQSSSRSAGGSWSTPANLSPESEDADAPQVATDATDEALAVWQLSGAGESVIQVASRGAGGAWAAGSRLSLEGRSASEPQISIDAGGDASAVWKSSDGTHPVIESASRPAGGSWGESKEISEAGQDASEPQVAVDPAGDAVAIWHRYDGSNFVIQSSFKPAGGAWRPPIDLSREGQSADEPKVAIDAGANAVAAWRRYDGSNYLIESSYKPSGGGWESPVGLSAANTNAKSPEVAGDSAGGTLAIWVGGTGSETIVQAAGKPPGGSWSGAREVSVIGASASEPEVATDPAGDGVAVWTHAAEGGAIVQSAGYDAAGPEVSASIPSAGTARQPVPFSVASFDIWSSLASVHWSFGDGSGAEGTTATHIYPSPGSYLVTVQSIDAVGNESSDSGVVTIYPRAWASRSVSVRDRNASLRVHCPNPLGCHGKATLTAAVETHRGRRHKKRRLIGSAGFALPGAGATTVRIRITKAGGAAVRKAGRKGKKAQLGGTGLKHRIVLLLERPPQRTRH
jgi:PKD domain